MTVSGRTWQTVFTAMWTDITLVFLSGELIVDSQLKARQPPAMTPRQAPTPQAGSSSDRTELPSVNAVTSSCSDARLFGSVYSSSQWVQHGDSYSMMEKTQIIRAYLSEQIPDARTQALNSALERPKNHLEEDGKWILKPSWPWVQARLCQDTHIGYQVLLDEGPNALAFQ